MLQSAAVAVSLQHTVGSSCRTSCAWTLWEMCLSWPLGPCMVAVSVTITPALFLILLLNPALPIPVKKMAQHRSRSASQHFYRKNKKHSLVQPATIRLLAPLLHHCSHSAHQQASATPEGLGRPPTAAPCQRCSTSPTTSKRLCLAMPCTTCDIARWAKKLAFF